MTPARLKPAAPRSRVKRSTTETQTCFNMATETALSESSRIILPQLKHSKRCSHTMIPDAQVTHSRITSPVILRIISRMTQEMPISVVRYGCTIYVLFSTTTYDYGCNTESYGPIRIATNDAGLYSWLIRRPVRECVTWALQKVNYTNKVCTI